ncbi:MAG: hypothetical protein EOM37_13265 [Proteobacteria bacterium]|nr:hypothetical protein [Pseudomonadota bacterium]NCC74239.1 hypothetical protein [Sphingobacteriia bacterium]
MKNFYEITNDQIKNYEFDSFSNIYIQRKNYIWDCITFKNQKYIYLSKEFDKIATQVVLTEIANTLKPFTEKQKIDINSETLTTHNTKTHELLTLTQSSNKTINFLIENTINNIINISPHQCKFKINISIGKNLLFKISTDYFNISNRHFMSHKNIDNFFNLKNIKYSSYIDLINSFAGKFFTGLHINKSGYMLLCLSFTVPFHFEI